MKGNRRLLILSTTSIPLAITISYAIIARVTLFSTAFDYVLSLVLIESSTPYGLFHWLNDRKRFIVERESLTFLADVESQVRSGRTVFEAIKASIPRRKKAFREIAGRYGLYTDLGMSPLEALREVSKLMPTQVSKEVFAIVERLSMYGGDVPSVLSTVRQYIVDLFELEDERRSIARNYGMVILMSFFMLLVIVYMLVKYLLIPSNSASTGLFSVHVSLATVMPLLSQFLIVEAFVSGLLIGKIITGKTLNGLVYSVMLIVVTVAFISIL